MVRRNVVRKSGARMYFGGVPLDCDLKKLFDGCDLKVGSMLLYKDLEAILGFDRKTKRWQSVMRTWRKKLELEHSIQFITVENIGYYVADANERLDVSGNKCTVAVRRLYEAHGIAQRTDQADLDQNGKRRRDHLMDMSSKAAKSMVDDQKKFLVTLPKAVGAGFHLPRVHSMLAASKVTSIPKTISEKKAEVKAVADAAVQGGAAAT